MTYSDFDVPLKYTFGYCTATPTRFIPTSFYSEYLVIDEVADDEVKTLPVDSRGCRFPDENDLLWAFPYYSYSACIAQCRVEAKMKFCNCTDRIVGESRGK